jgi:hypothetical protein
MILKYIIPDDSTIPKEIYEYNDNERLLVLLVGNNIIQTIKENTTLNNDEKIKELIYEKDKKINELEIINNSTITTFKNALNIEKEHVANEIIKEITKEKQNNEEKTRILKETFEKEINNLKNEKEKERNEMYIDFNNKLLKEKENMGNEINKNIELKIENYKETSLNLREELKKNIEIIKEQTTKINAIENEKIRFEEKIKYDEQMLKNNIEKEKNIIQNQLLHDFTNLQNSLNKEIENKNKHNYELQQQFNREKHNMEIQINKIKNDKEIEKIKFEEKIQQKTAELYHKIKETENTYKMKENEQLETIKNENLSLKEEIYKLINKQEHEKNILLNEKYEKTENTISVLHKTIEEIKIQTSKSGLSQNKGKTGENYFFELATDIFGNIDDFEIEDTTKTGHCGDYLLKFKEFTIMAECKNFSTSKVPLIDLRKFKADIKSNQHIRIAWLISLNKGISNYDSYPIQTEFENGVLYCYINSLFGWDEKQKDILISCWKFCKEIYLNFFDKENENTTKITDLMKQNNNKKLIAEKARKKIKEMKLIVEQFKNTIYELEKDLIEIIKGDVLADNENQINFLRNWWNENTIKEEEGKKHKLQIEEIFNKFKENNPDNDVDYDCFTLNLKSLLTDEFFSKNKNKNSKKYILSHKWV